MTDATAVSDTPGALSSATRKRRRSRHVSTLLLGAAALHLAACGDEPAQNVEAKIFPSIAACIAEFPEAECRQAFDSSQQMHMASAPRFDSQAACETAVGSGACQAVPVVAQNGGVSSVFVPALMGFMLARSLTPPGPGGYGFGYGGGYYQPRPIFVDRDGFLRSGGSEIGRINGGRDAFARSRSSTTVNVPTTRSGQIGKPTASRGGFGGTSARMSGGGGS